MRHSEQHAEYSADTVGHAGYAVCQLSDRKQHKYKHRAKGKNKDFCRRNILNKIRNGVLGLADKFRNAGEPLFQSAQRAGEIDLALQIR